MREITFPNYSEEERKEIWDNLKPNDVLVCIDINSWFNDYNVVYYQVEKRTPKGSIRLTNGELIKSLHSNVYLLNEEIKEVIKMIKLERRIIKLINEVNSDKTYFRENLQLNDALKLVEILEKVVKREEKNNGK